MAAASYSKYQFAVTKHHDQEVSSTTLYTQGSAMSQSPVNFDDFLDGEDIVQQDLVAWISIGMMHLPIAEDNPTQETIGNIASFTIRPFNYYDADPGMNNYQNVLYRKDGEGNTVEIENKSTFKKCTPKKADTTYSGTLEYATEL